VTTGLGLAVLLLGGMVLAGSMGYLHVPPGEVLDIALSGFRGRTDGLDPVAVTVVREVRFPRIVTAVLVGGILALCGAVFQAILLNPLADPYTLGVSSGAAFGASLVIVLQIFGLVLPELYTVPVFAFLGAVSTLFVVLLLASGDRRLSSTSLILSGVIVAAILSAAIGLLKFLADEQVGIIIFWLMGSLSSASWKDVLLLAVVGAGGLAIVLGQAQPLNIMATGERTAVTLGVQTVRLRWLMLITCSLMTAVCVAVSGIIGFVGLIVPHLLRHSVGPDNRYLLPLCFLGGGLLLLAADTLTRAVLPAEVPIGVLTALIGGPVFCILFRKRQQEQGG